MRPDLNQDLSVEQFIDFYWLKEELQTFCRTHGIRASGSKMEISERVDAFLRTGEIQRPARKANDRKKGEPQVELSLATVITKNHRCSQHVRAFFQTVIPNFHFSTFIQNYFKTHIGKTYRDAVDAWAEEAERKKDPAYQKTIAPQFEYNQFIRDFFADPKNHGKTREDAIKAWNEIKSLPGSNKYT
ncbi:DUF6434 domain-containing protein [Paenibacillus illinoisensis]|uniref:DUF6434 domain-containing protein n=1 Tax=Paenibacillus illinoisensis TaxID=59845 RepID=A0A2W0CI71_9BACL|nr:DUF6434 domain-containing protein [Paenibacillus illinoisensis]PYY29752.1 Uncharacterized protein PIL02S_01952 [Paenibacillus illinoisensis]